MAGGMVLGALLDHGRAWVTPDSVTYLGAANNLAHGKSVTSPFRSTLDPFSPVPSSTVPLLLWPPGFPAMLAIFAVIGVPPLDAAQVINLACVAILTALGGAIGWFRTRRSFPTVALAGLMLVSTTILQLGRFALSDLVFVTLCMAFL